MSGKAKIGAVLGGIALVVVVVVAVVVGTSSGSSPPAKPQYPVATRVSVVSSWLASEADRLALDEVSNDSDIVCVAFGKPGISVDQIMDSEDLKQNVEKSGVAALQAKGVSVVLTIGGEGNKGLFKDVVHGNPDGFVQAIKSVMTSYGFDGVDLDIQDPSLDQEKVVVFFQKLRVALPVGEKMISLRLQQGRVTGPRRPWDRPNDASLYVPWAKALKDWCDYFFLVGYNTGEPWGVSSDALKDVTDYSKLTGINASKMVLGMMPGEDEMKPPTCVSADSALGKVQGAMRLGLYGVGTWYLQRDMDPKQTGYGGWSVENLLKGILTGGTNPGNLPTYCLEDPPKLKGICKKTSPKNGCDWCSTEEDCGGDGSSRNRLCWLTNDKSCGVPPPQPGPSPAPIGWCFAGAKANQCNPCSSELDCGKTTLQPPFACWSPKDPQCGHRPPSPTPTPPPSPGPSPAKSGWCTKDAKENSCGQCDTEANCGGDDTTSYCWKTEDPKCIPTTGKCTHTARTNACGSCTTEAECGGDDTTNLCWAARDPQCPEPEIQLFELNETSTDPSGGGCCYGLASVCKACKTESQCAKTESGACIWQPKGGSACDGGGVETLVV